MYKVLDFISNIIKSLVDLTGYIIPVISLLLGVSIERYKDDRKIYSDKCSCVKNFIDKLNRLADCIHSLYIKQQNNRNFSSKEKITIRQYYESLNEAKSDIIENFDNISSELFLHFDEVIEKAIKAIEGRTKKSDTIRWEKVRNISEKLILVLKRLQNQLEKPKLTLF